MAYDMISQRKRGGQAKLLVLSEPLDLMAKIKICVGRWVAARAREKGRTERTPGPEPLWSLDSGAIKVEGGPVDLLALFPSFPHFRSPQKSRMQIKSETDTDLYR